MQEYLGYLLIPSTKAQKMLVMTGKGGEGKSRIGLLLKKLFGEASHSESILRICLLYTALLFPIHSSVGMADFLLKIKHIS